MKIIDIIEDEYVSSLNRLVDENGNKVKIDVNAEFEEKHAELFECVMERIISYIENSRPHARINNRIKRLVEDSMEDISYEVINTNMINYYLQIVVNTIGNGLNSKVLKALIICGIIEALDSYYELYVEYVLNSFDLVV